MRILFCSQTYLSKELGASKVLLELAEEMEQLGWECKLICPFDLVPAKTPNVHDKYHIYLRQYLQEHATEYDVIEFDYQHLPYPMSDFHLHTLFVAKVALLAHHFINIEMPSDKGLKSRIRSLIDERDRAARQQQRLRSIQVAFSEADLISVANYDDREAILKQGFSEEKILVIPHGISRSRRLLFDAISSAPPLKPKIAFIGTFDNRKGAIDFPEIVESVCAAVPNVEFRLLGTYRSEREVLAGFPKKLRGKIEVVPHYPADELPDLLAPCSVGVFPSYIEGFGLGVLEMLAASIPVIAYNSPGPPMMLSAEYLVPRGDTMAMGAKLIDLLRDQDKLTNARLRAKERSQEFCWQNIAKKTEQIYVEQWRRKQIQASFERSI